MHVYEHAFTPRTTGQVHLLAQRSIDISRDMRPGGHRRLGRHIGLGRQNNYIRCEFFEDAIYQANLLLLEGEDDRIPCLSPCMYEYMINMNSEERYPVK